MRISDWSSDVFSSDLLLRVDQLLAVDHHLAPQHLERGPIALAGSIGDDLAADRRTAGGRGGRVGIGVDHAEFQLRGLADQVLQLLRIVESRHLDDDAVVRSEEHTSELQSLMRISYAVFCLKKKTNTNK